MSLDFMKTVTPKNRAKVLAKLAKEYRKESEDDFIFDGETFERLVMLAGDDYWNEYEETSVEDFEEESDYFDWEYDFVERLQDILGVDLNI